MGYQIYKINGRDCGYGVPCLCEHPKCDTKIDRGISYVCGDEPGGTEYGCGLYFCGEHLNFHDFKDGETHQNCYRCDHYKPPYKEKPDILEWVAWKLYDESWEEWRNKNEKEVERLKKILIK